MVMFLTGKDITAIRLALGMNLREFGEKVGVADATVSRWESDQRRPKYEMMEELNRIAEEAGIKPRQPVAAAS